MKITREIKTAILVITSILLFIWGYSYLKGKDLFDSYKFFYAEYENVEGLTPSAPITINGLIIDKVKAKNDKAKIILAGMQVPPNMGPQYSSAFKTMFSELAKKNNIELVPFLLEGVGGETELNQADGIHPNDDGYAAMAERMDEELEKLGL